MTTPSPRRNGAIMIVDDTPANLRLLENMLRMNDYDVKSFPRARLALTAADHVPPDLMLLDINMPEMTGYELCESMRSNSRLAGIPVIFLSALNATEDKVKGFRSGGNDYISKPFQVDEVLARVATHIRLQRAQKSERELLEKTLNGLVGTMWELMQLTSPALASRSREIREVVRVLVEKLKIPDAWQYDLAATLCLVGCVTVPEEVLDKVYAGQELSNEEKAMYRAHPERGARLTSQIPRLEVVAEMIRLQQELRPGAPPKEPAALGASMLHLAFELNRKIHRGTTSQAALTELKGRGYYEERMLEALRSYAPAVTSGAQLSVPIREIRTGMILDEDILNQDGKLVMMKAGTVLTETWIERLENFARLRGTENVRVQVP
jgi:CheY-like chemotaxis protein